MDETFEKDYIVKIDTGGFPAEVRMKTPDPRHQSRQAPHDNWTVVLLPGDGVIRELMTDHADAGFPTRGKLEHYRQLIKAGQAIEFATISVAPDAATNHYTFQNGRHRTFVLAQLGAQAIPVAVPADCAQRLLLQFEP